jgi:hypothetical protein
MVGPGGVPPRCDSNDLFCPASAKASFDIQRQFLKLSSRLPRRFVASSNKPNFSLSEQDSHQAKAPTRQVVPHRGKTRNYLGANRDEQPLTLR